MGKWKNIFELETEDNSKICFNGDFGQLQVIEEAKKRYYNMLATAELITREQYFLLYKQLTELVKAEFTKEAERYNKLF